MNIMHDQNAHWLPQKRVLRLWLAYQRRSGSSDADDTEARLQELCASEGWNPDGSDGEEEEEEEMDNSEPLDDSDVILSDSGKMRAGNYPESTDISIQRDALIHVTFHVVCRRWSGGLWQDGVREEENRTGERCASCHFFFVDCGLDLHSWPFLCLSFCFSGTSGTRRERRLFTEHA